MNKKKYCIHAHDRNEDNGQYTKISRIVATCSGEIVKRITVLVNVRKQICPHQNITQRT